MICPPCSDGARYYSSQFRDVPLLGILSSFFVQRENKNEQRLEQFRISDSKNILTADKWGIRDICDKQTKTADLIAQHSRNSILTVRYRAAEYLVANSMVVTVGKPQLQLPSAADVTIRLSASIQNEYHIDKMRILCQTTKTLLIPTAISCVGCCCRVRKKDCRRRRRAQCQILSPSKARPYLVRL